MILILLLPWLEMVGGMSCDVAQMKCAFRTGCGNALHNYMFGCSELGRQPNVCPELCENALIALTSTKEGHQLTMCDCGNDKTCHVTKQLVEVCRPQVLRASGNTTVTCVVAQWICGADAPCANAFKYYHMYCRQMFLGRKCTPRCKNSIEILQRQEKAAKLDSCICKGHEGYDCLGIRRNMNRLCFKKFEDEEIERNEIMSSTPPSLGNLLQSSFLLLLLSSLNVLR